VRDASRWARGTIAAMEASARHNYTLDDARALLPLIRGVLLQVAIERHGYAAAHEELHRQLAGADRDPDAAASAQEERTAGFRERIASLVGHLENLGLEVRDLEAGLVDIPTERDGAPAWFCWRLEDPELGFWHTTREGFASRRPL
jgi:hypothetical protein